MMIKCCATCGMFEEMAPIGPEAMVSGLDYLGFCDRSRLVHEIDDTCDKWCPREGGEE